MTLLNMTPCTAASRSEPVPYACEYQMNALTFPYTLLNPYHAKQY